MSALCFALAWAVTILAALGLTWMGGAEFSITAAGLAGRRLWYDWLGLGWRDPMMEVYRW
jgi:hypothetical protein